MYELGYVPICPILSDMQYLQDTPDEQRGLYSIALQKLARCRMLVVCDREICPSMSAEIGFVEKCYIICTAMEGLEKIRAADGTID